MRIIAVAIGALAAIALGAVSQAQTHATAQQSTQQIIEDLERQSWVAWQHHDGPFYQHFLSEDHVEIHRTGPANKTQIVPFVASGACTVTSFTLGDMSFTQFSPDFAVLTYRAEQDTTCGNSRAPSPVWVTSAYVLRDGRWQNSIYVQTPTVDAH
jgi:hypothetical protein